MLLINNRTKFCFSFILYVITSSQANSTISSGVSPICSPSKSNYSFELPYSTRTRDAHIADDSSVYSSKFSSNSEIFNNNNIYSTHTLNNNDNNFSFDAHNTTLDSSFSSLNQTQIQSPSKLKFSTHQNQEHLPLESDNSSTTSSSATTNYKILPPYSNPVNIQQLEKKFKALCDSIIIHENEILNNHKRVTIYNQFTELTVEFISKTDNLSAPEIYILKQNWYENFLNENYKSDNNSKNAEVFIVAKNNSVIQPSIINVIVKKKLIAPNTIGNIVIDTKNIILNEVVLSMQPLHVAVITDVSNVGLPDTTNRVAASTATATTQTVRPNVSTAILPIAVNNTIIQPSVSPSIPREPINVTSALAIAANAPINIMSSETLSAPVAATDVRNIRSPNTNNHIVIPASTATATTQNARPNMNTAILPIAVNNTIIQPSVSPLIPREPINVTSALAIAANAPINIMPSETQSAPVASAIDVSDIRSHNTNNHIVIPVSTATATIQAVRPNVSTAILPTAVNNTIIQPSVSPSIPRELINVTSALAIAANAPINIVPSETQSSPVAAITDVSNVGSPDISNHVAIPASTATVTIQAVRPNVSTAILPTAVNNTIIQPSVSPSIPREPINVTSTLAIAANAPINIMPSETQSSPVAAITNVSNVGSPDISNHVVISASTATVTTQNARSNMNTAILPTAVNNTIIQPSVSPSIPREPINVTSTLAIAANAPINIMPSETQSSPVAAIMDVSNVGSPDTGNHIVIPVSVATVTTQNARPNMNTVILPTAVNNTIIQPSVSPSIPRELINVTSALAIAANAPINIVPSETQSSPVAAIMDVSNVGSPDTGNHIVIPVSVATVTTQNARPNMNTVILPTAVNNTIIQPSVSPSIPRELINVTSALAIAANAPINIVPSKTQSSPVAATDVHNIRSPDTNNHIVIPVSTATATTQAVRPNVSTAILPTAINNITIQPSVSPSIPREPINVTSALAIAANAPINVMPSETQSAPVAAITNVSNVGSPDNITHIVIPVSTATATTQNARPNVNTAILPTAVNNTIIQPSVSPSIPREPINVTSALAIAANAPINIMPSETQSAPVASAIDVSDIRSHNTNNHIVIPVSTATVTVQAVRPNVSTAILPTAVNNTIIQPSVSPSIPRELINVTSALAIAANAPINIVPSETQSSLVAAITDVSDIRSPNTNNHIVIPASTATATTQNARPNVNTAILPTAVNNTIIQPSVSPSIPREPINVTSALAIAANAPINIVPSETQSSPVAAITDVSNVGSPDISNHVAIPASTATVTIQAVRPNVSTAILPTAVNNTIIQPSVSPSIPREPINVTSTLAIAANAPINIMPSETQSAPVASAIDVSNVGSPDTITHIVIPVNTATVTAQAVRPNVNTVHSLPTAINNTIIQPSIDTITSTEVAPVISTTNIEQSSPNENTVTNINNDDFNYVSHETAIINQECDIVNTLQNHNTEEKNENGHSLNKSNSNKLFLIDFFDIALVDLTARISQSALGMAAGELSDSIFHIWTKVFYGRGKQRATNNLHPFTTHYSSNMIGMDMLITENDLIGIAYSHSNLQTKFAHLPLNKMQGDIYTFYSVNYLSPRIFIRNQLKYGRLKIKNNTIQTKGYLFGIRQNLGYEINIDNSWYIIPNIGISYDQIKLGKFENFQTKSFQVCSQRNERFNSILGINVVKPFYVKKSIITSSIHISLERTLNERSSIKLTNNTQFSDLKLHTKQFARSTINIGTKLGILTHNNIESKIGYDLIVRKKFLSHNISLSVNFTL